MNQLLNIGQSVTSQNSGVTYTICQFLGGGGQGEVYRVELDGQSMALKWFFPHYLRQDSRMRERIERAIQIGAPSDRFLWPVELVAAPGAPGFGYIMALRQPHFAGMAELVMRRVAPSFRSLATTGFELAHSYLQLHAKGLCYRDISFGNVFFDPSSGEVRISDNDNVDVDGQPGGIGGTARFMAPEIVRGEAVPSTQTDLFSLAVLLFYLFVNHHPLEGKREAAIRCFDLPAMTKLYGKEPLFIYDPQDTSNAPVPGYHDNAIIFWQLYPTFLRNLFTRAFTNGIHDPTHGRVRESEWRAAMVRLRDSIVYCIYCKSENFYDSAGLRAAEGAIDEERRCWSCMKALRFPPRIRIQSSGSQQGSNQQVIMLNYDTVLFPHHLDHNRLYDFSQPAAAVVQRPDNPAIWGLRNLTAIQWTVTTAQGDVIEVPSGKSVTIGNGTRINFGSSEGDLRL
jgi:eukaryotic-like serine/threonine-protein kinase